MGRIMGIDFGLKRTGISVTDPDQIIVQGLDTLPSHKALEFIMDYGKREPLDEIVVGYPFIEGAWGDKKFKLELDKFIEKIKMAFPSIPVNLHDERNTSMRAKEIIHLSGRKKSKQRDKALLDRTSAIIILQEYLGHI